MPSKPLLEVAEATSSNPPLTPSTTTATGGASLLIGLQVGSRALTFAVNQLLLRYLSPEIFGISVQLEVYSISVLFFARESLRVAIQRQTDEPQKDSTGSPKKDGKLPAGHVNGKTAAGKMQAIVNLAYLSIFLGVVFAVLLAWLYLRGVASDPAFVEPAYFQEAVKLYGFAAIWELLAEPCFVVVQHKSMYKIRASAEATATLLRCLGTCGLVIWASRSGQDLGVLPFAIGQTVYAVSLGLVYYSNVWIIASSSGFHLVLKPIFSSDASAYLFSYFSRPLLVLGSSIFVQGIVKHILTQGDTFLISFLASTGAQGAYALANNYGGLLARLVLQPVEESSRNYFGKLLSTVDGPPPKDLVLKACKNLQSLLRAYVLLSVCAVVLGPTIAPLLLNIVAGSRWTASGAGSVLATYCYYIPLLAINGVTEAFVSSVATESQVNRQSMWMLAFSAGFAGSAYIFLSVLELGAEGLVWANILNMSFRIIWSTWFIKKYLKEHEVFFNIGQILPRPYAAATGIGAHAVLTKLATTFQGGLPDLIKSGTVVLVFIVMLAANERVYLLELYRSFRGNARQD